jgi:hypothetical protein
MKNKDNQKTWKQPEWKAVKTAELTMSNGGSGTDGGGGSNSLT